MIIFPPLDVVYAQNRKNKEGNIKMTEQTYQKLVEDIRKHPKDWVMLIVDAIGYSNVDDIIDDIGEKLYPDGIIYGNDEISICYEDDTHPVAVQHPGTTNIVNVAPGGTYAPTYNYDVNITIDNSVDNSEHTEYHRSTNIGVGDNVIERFGNTIDNIIGNAVGNFFKKF